MFLIRVKEEFPDLVDVYRTFCEERDKFFLEKEFSYFKEFFAEKDIHISCEKNGETYQGRLNIYKEGAPEPLGESFEEPDKACEDAIYRAFAYLNDLEE